MCKGQWSLTAGWCVFLATSSHGILLHNCYQWWVSLPRWMLHNATWFSPHLPGTVVLAVSFISLCLWFPSGEGRRATVIPLAPQSPGPHAPGAESIPLPWLRVRKMFLPRICPQGKPCAELGRLPKVYCKPRQLCLSFPWQAWGAEVMLLSLEWLRSSLVFSLCLNKSCDIVWLPCLHAGPSWCSFLALFLSLISRNASP